MLFSCIKRHPLNTRNKHFLGFSLFPINFPLYFPIKNCTRPFFVIQRHQIFATRDKKNRILRITFLLHFSQMSQSRGFSQLENSTKHFSIGSKLFAPIYVKRAQKSLTHFGENWEFFLSYLRLLWSGKNSLFWGSRGRGRFGHRAR